MSEQRIAKLETYRETDALAFHDLSVKMDAIGADVHVIKLQMEKQKGFLAGCMFILLPIWSAFTVAAASLWDRLTGQ